MKPKATDGTATTLGEILVVPEAEAAFGESEGYVLAAAEAELNRETARAAVARLRVHRLEVKIERLRNWGPFGLVRALVRRSVRP